MQLTLENIKEVIKNNDSSNGVSSQFFKLTPKIGLKLVYCDYHETTKNADHKELRDIFYERQRTAAKHGLGPAVYGKIEVEINGVTRYGFLTEIVKIYKNTWNYDHKAAQEFKRFRTKHLEELRNNLLEKTGFEFIDAHVWNVGIKKKKLVCIDFGF